MQRTGFTGEYQHGLDGGGRVALPARYREAFRGEVILARLFEPCVNVFTLEGWEAIQQRLDTLSMFQEDARRIQRTLNSWLFTGEPDRQGRVLVPPPLRAYAQLEPGQPVVVIGAGNRLELWNPDLLAAERAVAEANISMIAERLGA